jgi:hypothetical protein
MKRPIILILILFVSTLTNAQIWGVKAGTGIADLSLIGSDEDPYSAKPLYFLGGFYSTMFTSHTGMTVELIYADKGGKSAGTTLHLHYVNVPVLFNYYFVDGKLRLEGGPELGYLASARTKYGSVDNIYSNKFDLGLDFGVAYKPTAKVSLGIRSNYGLFDVGTVQIRDELNQSTGEGNFRNRTVQVSFAYCFKCQ